MIRQAKKRLPNRLIGENEVSKHKSLKCWPNLTGTSKIKAAIKISQTPMCNILSKAKSVSYEREI